MAVNRDAVARRAKVSTAVVSYVINDGPKPVAAKTRERVLAAIDELGYRPDRAARQLARGGRSHTLGFIRANFESWYMNEVTELLSAAAERRGYHLFVTSSDNDLERERAQLIDMAERRVDGVILMPVDPSAEHLSFAQSLDLPVLVIDRPAIASRRTVAATQHMIEHRHERIAIVTGLRDRVNSERRRDAWERTLRDAGLGPHRELIHYAEETAEGGYAAAHELLGLDDPPTAIVARTDLQAIGVLRAAVDLGVAIPDGLATISTEGSALTASTVPSVSVVAQPVGALAEGALEAILARSHGEPGEVTNLEYAVHGRESCGCLPARVHPV